MKEWKRWIVPAALIALLTAVLMFTDGVEKGLLVGALFAACLLQAAVIAIAGNNVLSRSRNLFSALVLAGLAAANVTLAFSPWYRRSLIVFAFSILIGGVALYAGRSAKQRR